VCRLRLTVRHPPFHAEPKISGSESSAAGTVENPAMIFSVVIAGNSFGDT
jgi:hypothetical protein